MFHSGGYDRGECLDTVSVYDPATNEWRSADKMLTKRGRFDATVIGDVLFAVAGSNGTSELTRDQLYKNRSSRKIDSRRLSSRELGSDPKGGKTA